MRLRGLLGSTLLLAAGLAAAAEEELRLEGRIDPAQVAHEIGHCYIVTGQFPGRPDGLDGVHSTLQIGRAHV